MFLASICYIHHMHLYPFGVSRLSYDEGVDEESFEWVDFRELTDDEVRQHPSYIVVQPRPPPVLAPSASAAKPAAKAGSSNTEQVSFDTAASQLSRTFSESPFCQF